MSVFVKATIVVAAATLLLGCDRSSYATQPVVLKNDFGEVACQLYTVERTYWDHAVLYPETVTKAQADQLCQVEGERRKQAYKSALKGNKPVKESGGFFGIFGSKQADS